MQNNQNINRARHLYYTLFANFFVPPEQFEKYLELRELINLLRKNPLDVESGNALEKLYELLDGSSNFKMLEEFNDMFYNPTTPSVHHTASFYDEGFESGKKRVEMVNFVAKTKLRRDEQNYLDYEDSIGFILSLMGELTDEIANGNSEYENTVHCIFEQILNPFIDLFAKEIYEYPLDNKIYKELMVVVHSFVEFERLYLDVSKPIAKQVEEKQSCNVEDEISEEEKQRRARNKALKSLGPKKDKEPTDIAYDVETDL